MTLTEQWKKGELESGKEYWVRLTDEWKNSIEQVYFNGEDFERFDIDDIEEVLAPVPSYEEYQQLLKFLEEFNALEVAEENQHLKELIKEIRSLWKGTICMPDSQEQVRDILIKIDNVIGEKK